MEEHNVEMVTPDKFHLSQNVPNTFDSPIEIRFDIPIDANVKISIFDNLGRELCNLVNEYKFAGSYIIEISNKKLIPGDYFCRMKINSGSNELIITKKMNFNF